MEKVKLIIPDGELRDFSKFKNLKLNTNGKKSKSRGKNSYKFQLRKIQRMFR